jgi:hypothetical protein
MHTCDGCATQHSCAATLLKACCLNHLLGLVIAGKHTHVQGHGAHHGGATTTEQASNAVLLDNLGLRITDSTAGAGRAGNDMTVYGQYNRQAWMMGAACTSMRRCLIPSTSSSPQACSANCEINQLLLRL